MIAFLAIVILVLLNGIFVAAEFAIVGASKTRLATMAEEGDTAALKVLAIRRDDDRMNRYIATAQVGITVVSLGLGMVGEPALAEGLAHLFHRDHHEAWLTLVAILLLTYPHVVVGEMVPKALALQSAIRTAIVLRPLMALVEKVFLPLVVALNGMGNLLLRLLRVPPADESRHLFSPEEIEMVVKESREGGLVGASEELMVENIFDLSERTAGDVMTPRTRVMGMERDLTLSQALDRVCETGYSRHPVYGESLDHIDGILYTKDLARHVVARGEQGDLSELLRPARHVPASTGLEELLEIFRREHLQLAVVLDEYGGTAGLVSLEDVFEEVIGEIQDEFDQEVDPIARQEDGSYLVRGDVLLEELTQHLGRSFDHPSVKTLGGLVLELKANVPVVGDILEWEGVKLEVMATQRKGAGLVRLIL
ncbi:MAG: hemolysin family protein [Vulcanimicrobiota bacterium]